MGQVVPIGAPWERWARPECRGPRATRASVPTLLRAGKRERLHRRRRRPPTKLVSRRPSPGDLRLRPERQSHSSQGRTGCPLRRPGPPRRLHADPPAAHPHRRRRPPPQPLHAAPRTHPRTLTTAHRADCAPHARHGSARAYRSSSSTHPNVRAALARCGCRSLPPADAPQRNAAAYAG
jgi:hypothetical protein